MNNEYIYPSKDLLDNEDKDLESKYYKLNKILLKKDLNDKLIIPIGIDQDKKRYYVDLKDSSGIFIGGETGSGKSMLLDSLMITLLFKNSPDELKFILINPCRVELEYYSNLPHVMKYMIYDPRQAIEELNNTIQTIKERLRLLKKSKFKHINDYNSNNEEKLSHIIILIDESNDVMEQKHSKKLIKKILKKGHYAGVHLILATSSYFKKDFDKSIINSFSHVLSLDLASKEQADFINLKGADLLTVAGEALVRTSGSINKIQVPYVSDKEIKKVLSFIEKENSEIK